MMTRNTLATLFALAVIAPLVTACDPGDGDGGGNGDGGGEPTAAQTSAADTRDTAGSTSGADTGGDPCNSALVTPFLGRNADEATRAAVRQAIAPVDNVRWVGPEDAMTMDYRPDRLTLELDSDGAITTASCG